MDQPQSRPEHVLGVITAAQFELMVAQAEDRHGSTPATRAQVAEARAVLARLSDELRRHSSASHPPQG